MYDRWLTVKVCFAKLLYFVHKLKIFVCLTQAPNISKHLSRNKANLYIGSSERPTCQHVNITSLQICTGQSGVIKVSRCMQYLPVGMFGIVQGYVQPGEMYTMRTD